MDVYIKNRNKVILAFLNGFSYREQEMKKQLTLKTCVALEHLYGMSTKYFVAPMYFVNNIMQCQATQSRMCINLNGKTGPAGSYKTVSNWLVSQSTKELDFPQSDCMVAFDNDQVVGKSWRISTDNKVKSSCVTSICAVAIDTGSCNFSKEQFKIANHPKNWFNYTGFVQKLDNIRNQDGTYFDKVYDTHYQMLCHNLDKHMSLVYQAQMSRIMRKPAFGICENKDADQLRGNRKADQRLCFRYIHSPIPLFS